MKIDELQLLRCLLPTLHQNSSVAVGPGDDCAVLHAPEGGSQLLVTTDQLIENVHFTQDTPAKSAGRKLMNRNISDIASMGGIPLWAVWVLSAGSHDSEWILQFSEGVRVAGEEFSVSVVGGDLAGMTEPGVVSSLTLIGSVPQGKAVLRSTARPGDKLYVTGKIGNSFCSGRHLSFQPRVKEGLFLRDHATAMMDISDGVLLDAQRLAQASHVALRIAPDRVPLHPDASLPAALRDGEDYELLFTAPRGLQDIWPAELVPVTEIGEVLPGDGELFGPDGKTWTGKFGYEH